MRITQNAVVLFLCFDYDDPLYFVVITKNKLSISNIFCYLSNFRRHKIKSRVFLIIQAFDEAVSLQTSSTDLLGGVAPYEVHNEVCFEKCTPDWVAVRFFLPCIFIKEKCFFSSFLILFIFTVLISSHHF